MFESVETWMHEEFSPINIRLYSTIKEKKNIFYYDFLLYRSLRRKDSEYYNTLPINTVFVPKISNLCKHEESSWSDDSPEDSSVIL